MVDHIAVPGYDSDRPEASSPQSLGPVDNSATFRQSLWRERAIALLFRPSLFLLILVTVVLTRGIAQGEFFYYGDEMRHAMNGAFFRDFLVDLPLQHPLQYTYEYYAKYPALAFPHWPPLFHFIEGVFFLLFGFSPWVSRLVVLGFALLAVYFWYRIAERFGPRYRAFLSAVILACIPFLLLYERVTMLEIPVLGACLGAIHFWLRFLETERRRDLWTLAAFSAAALLINQKAIFLPLFIVFDFAVERRFHLLKRFDIWLAALVSAAAVLPWYMLASRTLSFWSGRVAGDGSYLSLGVNYTFYLTQLYKQLGPVLLCLGCVGLLLALLKRSRADRFFLIWILSGYICFVLIREKDPRHTMLWVPPLFYFGLAALETLFLRRIWALIGSTVLALVFFVNALRSERPKVDGAKEAAEYVLSLPESDIVYYQGYLGGDFIFFVRKFDSEKRHMVAREKQVVVSDFGQRPTKVLHTKNEILSFFQAWGIRYAVIEDRDEFPALGPVRELMNSDQFELLRTIPIRTNLPNFSSRQIQVFRFRGELHRTNQTVSIPMMTIRKNISADLSRLAGRPWPN